jgi:hypothetical protein
MRFRAAIPNWMPIPVMKERMRLIQNTVLDSHQYLPKNIVTVVVQAKISAIIRKIHLN